jgi:hypothetical protein
MNPAIISALAALGGSVVGDFAPIVSNYMVEGSRRQSDLMNRQIAKLEELHSDFINEASRLYAHSITHTLEDLNVLVTLYAFVSQIRLLASEPVLSASEDLVKRIVERFGEPNLTIEQLRAVALSAKADPLDVFSSACRKELRDLLQR